MARPLTKRQSTGDLYVRPQHVERQIDDTLAQDQATLQRRLAVSDPQSSDYLRSECLVHLARDFLRNGNDSMANTVLPILLGRCKRILLAKIPANELPTAREVREEVLGQFGELFADATVQGSDDLDYFECRFNGVFRTFYINLVRSEKARLKRLAPLPDQADDTHKELQSPETADSALLCKELREAIDALPDDMRKAVILCHIEGYKIESNNPSEATAATICKVSGRTIRNRLLRAAGKLSKFKDQ